MKKIKLLLGLLLLANSCFSTNDRLDLSTTNIADSLKKDAYAVVRYSNTGFEYKSETSGFEKKSIAISILDKKGSDFSAFRCSCDKFRELTSFSGKLFDANGKLLRKFSMSDVSRTEYSRELASDAKLFYLDCDLPSYPVTIMYEYEVSWKNGILVFPSFTPQTEHNLSVEKANYQLIMPEKTEYRSKAINISFVPKQSTIKGITKYLWSVENLCAIQSELFQPDLETYVPLLYLSPKNFVYDDVPGVITNWKSMGEWEHKIINGRNILSEETKKQIVEMTKNAKSDREKVQILYDYLGKTTHYVSIQLGIGGYQPMPASEVCKTGFGDCKGLSNYLKSMLDVIKIPSNNTVIRFDKNQKSLFQDYSSFQQLNHMILQVPLPNDTLWLECTNPRTPFGFVHNGISGHDALVISDQGGVISHLPDYADSLNIELNCVNVGLNADGSANVIMKKDCRLKTYDNYDWFPLAKSSEQADNLREDIKLPSVAMGPIQVNENKSSLPNLAISYTWTTPLYGSKTGSRLFVPANPYRSMYEGLKKSKRVHDISISGGFKDIDSIYITIPEEFEIESLPAPTVLKTIFGTFESNIKAIDKKILVQQSLFIPSGEYKVTEYPDFVAFFEKISSNYKSKIIVRKRAA